MKRSFLFILLLSQATTAWAQQKFDTVGDVLGICRSAAAVPGQVNTMPEGYCLGVVAGTLQTLLTACATARDEGAEVPFALTMARPPGEYPSYAATQAFVNWAEDNPDNWDMPFTLAVIVALPLAFPCR